MAIKITKGDPKGVLEKASNLALGATIIVFGGPAVVSFRSSLNKVARVYHFERGEILDLQWSDHYQLIDCELTWTTRKGGN